MDLGRHSGLRAIVAMALAMGLAASGCLAGPATEPPTLRSDAAAGGRNNEGDAGPAGVPGADASFASDSAPPPYEGDPAVDTDDYAAGFAGPTVPGRPPLLPDRFFARDAGIPLLDATN